MGNAAAGFILLVCFNLLFPTPGFAWGERGHDLVTRVAVRLVATEWDNSGKLSDTLLDKAHLLGHLSNVPDIVWRSEDKVGKAVTAANGPTHYVDMDYIAVQPMADKLPTDLKLVEKQIEGLCANPPKGYECPKDSPTSSVSIEKVGTAPWRIAQLTRLLQQEFTNASKSDSKKEFNEAIDQALLYAGILSHFVGDLGNPYHNARDYDGWEVGQGGIHKYFESECVARMPLDLSEKVFQAAKGKKLFESTMEVYGNDKAARTDPVKVAFALGLDSFKNLATLNKLDKDHAMLKASSQENGLKIKAKRRPPAETYSFFQPMAVERMAYAASTLAYLWQLAWRQGGAPDLQRYNSYTYHYAPEFIEPDYLPGKPQQN